MEALRRVQRVRLVIELLEDRGDLSAAAAAELRGHLAVVEASIRAALREDRDGPL